MRKRRKLGFSVLAAILCLFMTASVFKTPEMTLDTSQNTVYQNESLEYFMIRRAASSDTAKDMYQNGYYVFLGTIRSKSGDGRRLTLGILGSTSLDTLSCSASSAEV